MIQSGKKTRIDEFGNLALPGRGGPSFILPSGTVYFLRGVKFHREDGPAVIRHDGVTEYWLAGNLVHKEEYETKKAKRKQRNTGPLQVPLQHYRSHYSTTGPLQVPLQVLG